MNERFIESQDNTESPDFLRKYGVRAICDDRFLPNLWAHIRGNFNRCATGVLLSFCSIPVSVSAQNLYTEENVHQCKVTVVIPVPPVYDSTYPSMSAKG